MLFQVGPVSYVCCNALSGWQQKAFGYAKYCPVRVAVRWLTVYMPVPAFDGAVPLYAMHATVCHMHAAVQLALRTPGLLEVCQKLLTRLQAWRITV